MPDAYILGYARSPFGKRNGALAGWRPDDLAAFTLDALLERHGVDGREVDDVILGTVSQVGEQGGNLARLAVLLSKRLTEATPATTVNRVCGSGEQALAFAAQAVAAGQADLVVAGGVETMTRVPIGSDMGEPNPRLLDAGLAVHQGEGAERIAERWDLAREALDAFSLESHRRAVAAQDRGFFKREIAPVPVEGGWVESDEQPRRATSMEALAKLKPAFRPAGVITAGNSSPINDGAAALLVGTREKARALGLEPLARVGRTVAVGSDPRLVLTGPIPATEKLLAKEGLAARDVAHWEVNEAFAPVVLAWQREIGVEAERVNPNGGAIALGHPLGASGARLAMTAVNALHATGQDRAVLSMCIGFGQGIATLIERA